MIAKYLMNLNEASPPKVNDSYKDIYTLTWEQKTEIKRLCADLDQKPLIVCIAIGLEGIDDISKLKIRQASKLITELKRRKKEREGGKR